MTHLVGRLAELRKQLDHLRELRPRIEGAAALRRDLSLHNDVLFSLPMVCQVVIDVSGELAVRRGIRSEDYTGAVRALDRHEAFPPTLVARISRLPGFRKILVHDYVALDYERVVAALDELEPVEEFVRIVAQIEQGRDTTHQ